MEDLFQAVFLKLFERDCRILRQYEGRNGCSLSSWLRVIAVRTVIDHHRASGRDAILRPERKLPLEGLPEIADSESDPLSQLEKAEQFELIEHGLATLEPRDRLFIKLHFSKRLSILNTAEILGISEANAYSVKHRALKRLKGSVMRIMAENVSG